MSLKEKLFSKLEAKEQQMIETRRHLHANPELSFKEENTASLSKIFIRTKMLKSRQMLETVLGLSLKLTARLPGKQLVSVQTLMHCRFMKKLTSLSNLKMMVLCMRADTMYIPPTCSIWERR